MSVPVSFAAMISAVKGMADTPMATESIGGGNMDCGNEDGRRSKRRLQMKRSHISPSPHSMTGRPRFDRNETVCADKELDSIEDEARGSFPSKCGIHLHGRAD